MSLAVKPMLFSSSSVTLKSGDGFSGKFPAGLRVLVVDDDPTCLRIMEIMLKNCLYEVTKCDRAELALKYLRDNKNGFDIVISDVHMPDMDGFKLLEHVGLEMDLPVIMMSADDSKSVVMKGVIHGACDYLIKPIRMEALKNIWQHVVRKKKHDGKDKDIEQSRGVDDGEQEKLIEDVDYSSSANEGRDVLKKRKDEDDDDEADERDDSSALKKPRVVWSSELHQQFMNAVHKLGIDKAVPKKILELMNVPGLTRENVASHLQKYRLYLKRLYDTSPHQLGLNNSFIGPSDATFSRISSVGGLDYQALASASHFTPQNLNLAAIQAAALGRAATNSSLSVARPEQRNIFNFENPRLRLGEGPQQQNNNGKQINLLHGIPTNMDSKQLAALQQQSFNMNVQAHSQAGQNSPLMAQLAQTQPQSRPQSAACTAINGNRVLDFPSSVGQSGFSPTVPTTLFGRSDIENVRRPVYPSISRPLNAVDFSRCRSTEFPSQNFSAMTSSGISNLTSQGMLQEMGSEMKGPRTFAPSYGVFNELNQNTAQDWSFQNAGSIFEVPNSNMRGRLSVSPSVGVQQAISSNQNCGQNKNTIVNNGLNNGHQLNSSLPENSMISEAERLPSTSFQSGLFPEHYVQDDDLMTALLKQEGTDHVENEFGFGGYHLDNLS